MSSCRIAYAVTVNPVAAIMGVSAHSALLGSLESTSLVKGYKLVRIAIGKMEHLLRSHALLIQYSQQLGVFREQWMS